MAFNVAELYLSDDATDHRFYSTCYKRETLIEWLPTGKEFPKPPAKYQFGNQCLDCASFDKNFQMQYNISVNQARSWVTADGCSKCLEDGTELDADAARARFGNLVLTEPRLQSDGGGSEGETGF